VRAIRKINNNAAVCIDARGHEVVALGNGVGFGTMPHEVDLSDIVRTFYGIDKRYLALIEELPAKELEFAAQFSDIVRSQVSHPLSPNLPVTLADHISFAIKRAREHMIITMPLAYDVEQTYPVEYRLGELCVNGISRTFQVKLPRSEAVGIALSIVGSSVSLSEKRTLDERRMERLIDKVTLTVEQRLNIEVPRDSFDYARFATHVRYLIKRVVGGKPFETSDSDLYSMLSEEYPEATACATEISQLISDTYQTELGEEERAYLILHVHRVYSRALEDSEVCH